jgi:hypothetical protein
MFSGVVMCARGCRERKKMNVIGTQPTHVLIVSRLLQGERRSFVFYPVEEEVRPCSRERVMYILVHWFSFFWGKFPSLDDTTKKYVYVIYILFEFYKGFFVEKMCQKLPDFEGIISEIVI